VGPPEVRWGNFPTTHPHDHATAETAADSTAAGPEPTAPRGRLRRGRPQRTRPCLHQCTGRVEVIEHSGLNFDQDWVLCLPYSYCKTLETLNVGRSGIEESRPFGRGSPKIEDLVTQSGTHDSAMSVSYISRSRPARQHPPTPSFQSRASFHFRSRRHWKKSFRRTWIETSLIICLHFVFGTHYCATEYTPLFLSLDSL
jgi:hypothetical protein